MRIAFLTLAIAVLAPGCFTYEVEYEIALREVERLAPGGEKLIVAEIRRLARGDVTVYVFEDETLSIFWAPRADEFRFKLVNKTDRTLKIVWDEAVFVDEKGENHRLVHSGIQSDDAYKHQPASLVVKKGILSEAVFRVDHIEKGRGSVEKRRVKPIFPKFGRSMGALKSEARKVVGKTVKILLPVRSGESKADYTFTFLVRGFSVR